MDLAKPGCRLKETAIRNKIRRWLLSSQFLEDLIQWNLDSENGRWRLQFDFNHAAFQKLLNHRLGRTVLLTNRMDWTAEQVVAGYSGQQHVEQVFRGLKDGDWLGWGPMYHWTDSKIVSGKPGASTTQPWDFLRWVHEKSHSQFNDRKKTNGWRASGDGRTVLSQWSDSACVLPERRGGQVDAGLVAAQEQGTPQKEARGVSGSGAGVGGHGDNFELGDGNPQPGGMDDSLTADAERGRDGAIAAGAAMLSVSPATRVFVALNPVDMRRSFNGLYAQVQSVLKEDPLSGHLFVFTNRLRNRIKVIFFDGSGLWVCAKRLERGTFGWPTGEGVSCSLRPEQLQLLLHGMEATSRQRCYRR